MTGAEGSTTTALASLDALLRPFVDGTIAESGALIDIIADVASGLPSTSTSSEGPPSTLQSALVDLIWTLDFVAVDVLDQLKAPETDEEKTSAEDAQKRRQALGQIVGGLLKHVSPTIETTPVLKCRNRTSSRTL